jgi:hypothetical protein
MRYDPKPTCVIHQAMKGKLWIRSTSKNKQRIETSSDVGKGPTRYYMERKRASKQEAIKPWHKVTR